MRLNMKIIAFTIVSISIAIAVLVCSSDDTKSIQHMVQIECALHTYWIPMYEGAGADEYIAGYCNSIGE
jgi:hypothetical protein